MVRHEVCGPDHRQLGRQSRRQNRQRKPRLQISLVHKQRIRIIRIEALLSRAIDKVLDDDLGVTRRPAKAA